MDSKIKTLLEKLNISDESKEYFNDAKLLKIVGNLEKTKYIFYIEINKALPIENYKEFISALKISFESIDYVDAVFTVRNKNNELITDYVKECLNILSSKSAMLKMFLDNKMEYDEDLKIYVDNVAELKKLEEYKLNIEEYLNKVGFDVNINIFVE